MNLSYKCSYTNKLEIYGDKIVFNDNFNEPLINFINILSLCKIVVFGRDFNQNLSVIPNNIEKIFLGRNFKKSVIDIPISITSIIFANDSIYSNSIDYLHNNVKELILGDNYNITINKLPNSLLNLVLGKNYCLKIKEFSQGLTYLDIGDSYYEPLDNLPDNLNTLVIGGIFNNFIRYPNNLKHFTIRSSSLFDRELDNLPKSLIYLSIQNYYSNTIKNMPNTILCLSLGDHYNGFIYNFSNNLKKIILSKNFSHDFINLPDSLEIIELEQSYKFIDFLKFKFPKIKLIIR